VFEVVFTSVDTPFGGADFDRRVVDYLLKLFKQELRQEGHSQASP
jgi:molecular chaperone DnaK (HSP70)